MRNSQIDPNAIYQPLRGACQITGLSVKYLGDGCRAGTIPAIRVGRDWRINMPAFLRQLNELSGVKNPGGGTRETD